MLDEWKSTALILGVLIIGALAVFLRKTDYFFLSDYLFTGVVRMKMYRNQDEKCNYPIYDEGYFV
jgi:hypothetical protein